MEDSQKRRRRRLLYGRHPLAVGALALLGLSGYELWIRLEDFWAWTSGIHHLSKVRGTPFLQDMAIIFQDPPMRQLGFKMLFLLGAVIFAIICLFYRNKARGAWVLLILDIALAAGGAALGLFTLRLSDWAAVVINTNGGIVGLFTLRPSDWAQALKLAPLALIAVGCVTNLCHRQALRRHRVSRLSGEKMRERK